MSAEHRRPALVAHATEDFTRKGLAEFPEPAEDFEEWHDPQRSEAWNCLTPRLQRGWEDMQRYVEELGVNAGKRKKRSR